MYDPNVRYREPPLLLRNEQGKKFVDVSAASGDVFHQDWAARGLAVGDINNDGKLDAVITSNDGPAWVLLNQTRHAEPLDYPQSGGREEQSRCDWSSGKSQHYSRRSICHSDYQQQLPILERQAIALRVGYCRCHPRDRNPLAERHSPDFAGSETGSHRHDHRAVKIDQRLHFRVRITYEIESRNSVRNKLLCGGVLLVSSLMPVAQVSTPSSTASLLQDAAQAMTAGKLTRAETDLQTVLRTAPDDYRALDLLGVVRVLQHRDAEAEQLFRRAVQKKADFAPAHAHLGLLYFQKGRADDAVPKLREALRIDSARTDASDALVHILRDQSKTAAAAGDSESRHGVAARGPQLCARQSRCSIRIRSDGDATVAMAGRDRSFRTDIEAAAERSGGCSIAWDARFLGNGKSRKRASSLPVTSKCAPTVHPVIVLWG